MLIYPDHIKLFEKNRSDNFCLITTDTPECQQIVLAEASCYQKTSISRLDSLEDVIALINSVEKTDFVYIPFGKDDRKYLRPTQLSLTQRLITFNCCSTEINAEILSGFIALLHNTEPDQQIELAENFFNRLNGKQTIAFVNEKHHTEASLSLDADLLWTEALGYAAPGETITLPYGEIAISHVNFREDSVPALPTLNGEIILEGQPILHRIIDKTRFPDSEFKRLFKNLMPMITHPIKVVLKKGGITDLIPLDKAVAPAVKTLNALFEMDSRLRTLSEIGLGINAQVKIMENYNTVLNEPYGHPDDICVHFGIGGGCNIFHADFICPETKYSLQ